MFRGARRGRQSERVGELITVTGLSEEDRRAYLELLLRGASPAVACQQLNLDLFTVVEAVADDDDFRMEVDAVYDALSQNVAARLYQEAMKGSVTAMTNWLKHRPPPEWSSTVVEGLSVSSWDLMSDEELLAHARLEKIEIPVELERSDEPEGGESASESFSGGD